MSQHNDSTATKASHSSPMNRTTKGLVHLPLSESFKAESGAFTTTIRGTTHNWIGAPERLQVTTKGLNHHKASRVQRPKSNKLTKFTSTNPRGEHKPMHKSNGKSTSAQILHSQIPPKATNAYGGRREEEQIRTQQMELQDLDPKGSPHLEERWIDGIIDLDLLSLFPLIGGKNHGGIERKQSFKGSRMEVKTVLKS